MSAGIFVVRKIVGMGVFAIVLVLPVVTPLVE